MLGTLVYSALDVTFNTAYWAINKTFSGVYGVYGLYNWYYDENTDENTDKNPDKNTDKNPDKNTDENPDKNTDENTENGDSESIKYFLIDRINQQDEKIKTLEAELIELQNLKK